MTIRDGQPVVEVEIRARLDQWARALCAKDIDEMMSQRSPDIVAFDCHSRLQLRGADALRRHLEACLPCMQGPMLFEMHDLDVTAQHDIAFCHYLARCGATGADGEEHVSWLRATTCLRRTHGEWTIVHEHLSAPFDPESGQAMLGLVPEHAPRASAA